MSSNFEVKCKTEHGGLYLSITHDGHQWTSINIKDSDHEVPLIIEALHNLTTRPSKAKWCQCYEKGQKPPLLTDWRWTNICQNCGNPRVGK